MKDSSFVAYLSHWFWAEIPNKYLVYDYQLPFWAALPIVIFCTLLGIWVTVRLFKCCPPVARSLGMTVEKKKTKSKVQNEENTEEKVQMVQQV